MHTDGSHQEAAPAGTSYPGAIAIAGAIKDMRAISVVNILANSIPKEQAEDLIKTMKNKKGLKSLCGIKPDQQDADFSGQGLGVVDAMLIANDISDNGALTHLDISSNIIGGYHTNPGYTNDEIVLTPEGLKAIADVLPNCQ
jgi:hypothetical protein